MREFLPRGEDIGWLSAAVLIMVLVIKYAPTWFRAFRETHNVATSNLLTGLQRQIDSLNETLRQKEHTISNLVRQEKELREEVNAMRSELRSWEDWKRNHDR